MPASDLPEPADRPLDPAAGVLSIADALVAELRGQRARRTLTLEDSLERDLGIGSLERVELVLRLERAFGVRLPDRVMAEADTLRDLVTALRSGGDVLEEGPAPAPARLAAAEPAPRSVRTIPEALAWHVQRTPERIHIFLRGEDGGEHPISYGALWTGASRVAASLAARGIGRGDTVGIMLPTGDAFFRTFLGTLLAGAIPVPLYPPFRADRIEEYVVRQVGILRNAETRLLVTFAQVERVARVIRAQVSALQEVVTADQPGDAAPGGPGEGEAARATGDVPLHGGDLALIQYTSGSTGAPKGVALTHDNLLANLRALGDGLHVRPHEVVVSWLPLYHDMGLIGAWLGSLYYGVPLAIMSPLAFLSRPARWLWSLHRHRGTLSPAPNFAYDLCAKRITDEELEGLDLSSVRLLLNGSEAVIPATLERFTARFTPYGLRPEALCPVYGLAECAVGLTMPPADTRPTIDYVVRRELQETGRAVPVTEGRAASPAETLAFVGCGRAIPGHEVRVVAADQAVVAERVQGRIQFRGPSMTPGYFHDADATSAIMTRDGWADTGDLGYLAGGMLFITGRRKDLIIKAGRNIYPPELEEIVGSVPGVRRGCVAAFGVPDPASGTERLVIVAETRERDRARLDELRAFALDRVATTLGVPPDEIVLAPPGAVLKTSSGKIRRGATRDAYLDDRLGSRRPSVAAQWLRLAVTTLHARFRRAAGLIARIGYTAYVALLLAAGLPVLLAALAVIRRPAAADRVVRGFCRVLLSVAGCRIAIRGQEHFANLGPAILVANHASYIDAVIVLGTLPMELTFAAKGGLARYPVLGQVIRRAGYVTVDRTGHDTKVASADQLREALEGGRSLFVFPEGTFVRAPGLLPFRLGAFRTAVETRLPVVPMALDGTRVMFPDGAWLLRPTPLTLTICEPLRAQDEGWSEIVRLRDSAREQIVQHLDERERMR